MKTIARLTCSALLGALLLGALVAVPAGAAPTDSQARYSEVQSRLAEARAKIAAASQRESALGKQVAGFDAKLDALGGELAEIDARMAVVRGRLDKARVRLHEARVRLRDKTEQLRDTRTDLEHEEEVFEQRVVAMYKKGDTSYVDVLLGADDFEDLVSRVALVRTLVGADNDLVGRLETLRDRFAAEKEALAEDEAVLDAAETELARRHDELAALRAEAAAKQQSLAAARAAKAGVLQEVAQNRQAWERQEDQLLAESRQLAAIIAGGGGGGHGTGQLIWPVNGVVTSGFGWRMHPIFHVPKFHTGIDIGAAYGTPVKAADSGSVIFSGWMGGYGNVVVLDHGKGLSTLCAHMSTRSVSQGGGVARGQVIGNVGSTGFSTGPHLHFEVRLNGNPVDPLGYLP